MLHLIKWTETLACDKKRGKLGPVDILQERKRRKQVRTSVGVSNKIYNGQIPTQITDSVSTLTVSVS